MAKTGTSVASFLLWIGTAALAGAAASLLFHHVPAARAADDPPFVHPVVRAKSFQLVNDAGECMAEMSLSGGHVSLVMHSGLPIGVWEKDGYRRCAANQSGPGIVIVADKDKKEAYLAVFDQDRKTVWKAP